jgi:hypothetical protein
MLPSKQIKMAANYVELSRNFNFFGLATFFYFFIAAKISTNKKISFTVVLQ